MNLYYTDFIYAGKRPIIPPEQAELTTANFLLSTSVNVSRVATRKMFKSCI